MVFLERFALLLLIAWPILSNAEDDGKTFVVGLLPDPVYEKSDVMWPVPSEIGDVQTIKVTITNTGDAPDDVGFHTFFPDYAEMTSFTMHTEGVAYEAKRVDHAVAQDVLDQAKKGDHAAALHAPKRLPDVFNPRFQTTENSVHIKGNTELTFNVEYKETVQEMIDSGSKIQNRAQVVFDLFGSTVRDMVGEISSPNYPQPYPNSADIAWLIRVPDDNIVELSIVDIDIEECCDRLTIYDGNSLHGREIASLSGSLADQNGLTQFQSTGSSMSVHLLSDCSETRSGFIAVTSVGVISSTTPNPIFPETTQITTIPADPVNTTYPANNGNCSHQYLYANITDGFYYISSPNYPDSYYDNINCVWYIITFRGHGSISLKVLDLDLESNYDYLYIYNSNGEITVLTGSDYPLEPILSQVYVLIEFVTDSSVTRSGFNLQYRVVPSERCNETQYLVADSSFKNITSMNYPYYYNNNLHCTWSIHSSDNAYVVQVYIADYDLEFHYDFLVFYDGPSQYFEQIPHSFEADSYLYSSSTDMFITFITDASGTYDGFLLMYKSTYRPNLTPSYEDPSSNNVTTACDTGLYIDVDPYTYSYVYSPNYPHLYGENLNCTWYIETTHQGHGVDIQVNDALLHDMDSVRICEDWDANDYWQYISNNQFSRYLSPSSKVQIDFTSNNFFGGKGFLFLVKSSPIPSCVEGDTLDIYSGYSYLTSPNYPNGYYNNMHCSWTIHSHNGYYIQLDVVDLDIKRNNDYVGIYDGPNSLYLHITDLYTDDQPPMYSTGEYLFVTFSSYVYQPSIGFQLKYSTTTNNMNDPSEMQNNCHIVHYISQSSGTITSNNYPSNYTNDADECWIFLSSYGVVDLTFDDFYADGYSDILYLYSGIKYLDNFYGSYSSYQRTYYGYSLWLQFVTDDEGTARGFSIDYDLSN